VAYTAPTVADFKARFDRDFGFAADQTDMERVRDTDITRGITSASVNFNEALWESQAIYAEAYLLLAAHYLVTNLLNSSQGLGSQANWLTNSKSVMSVTESFIIPDRIARSPILAIYSKTGYGMEYLSLIMLRLIGNVALVQGNTTP
jgi:hypothetical protein